MRDVALAASAARFVAAGGRDVAWRGDAGDGDTVRALTETGDDLGLAVVDADNGLLRVIATPADGFATLDGAVIGLRVERALALRRALGIADGGAAYRLVHGAGDGLPGLACDVLGEVAVVYAYGAGLRALARVLADAAIGFAKLRGAVVKLRTRGGAGEVEQEVVGRVAEQVIATEAGVGYELHPLGGLNTGLFTDMREHRRGLARYAGGARVLNLFSYTGSLGLACARGGAAEVVNVDTADGVQAWARGNFARNGCAARFVTGDALRFVARAGKDGERYDLVVIDPPTASPARGGKGWLAGRDYPGLIAAAAEVVPAGGTLWLAMNGVDGAALTKLARDAVRGRGAAVVEIGGLPPEYPTLLAQPADRYLQILVLRLG